MSERKQHRRWLQSAAAGTGLSAVLVLGLAGCNGCNTNGNTAAPIANGAPPADNSAADPNGQDPAFANLASGALAAGASTAAQSSGQTKVLSSTEQYAPQQSGESYSGGQQPAPIVNGYSEADQQVAYSQGYDDAAAAGEQAIADADQPPPPLPEYDQPPAPDPNYLWTPGYWSYGEAGYYWVPGAWTAPPYYGALWTPPYWGWSGHRYHYYHGYWGPHVGYYGGINYGFGYIGFGYFGGYWRGHDFFYNREVTHVGPGVRNFYSRPVVYNNVHYGPNITNRVSYNGGRGGVDVRPRPAEVAAMHEAHYGPTNAQRQDRISAAGNRGQAFSANHGAPAMAFAGRPLGDRGGIANAPAGANINHGQPAGAVNRGGFGGGGQQHGFAGQQPGGTANRGGFAGNQPHPNLPQPGAAANRGSFGRDEPHGEAQQPGNVNRGGFGGGNQPHNNVQLPQQHGGQPQPENHMQPRSPVTANGVTGQGNRGPESRGPENHGNPGGGFQPHNNPAPQPRSQAAPQPQQHGFGGGGGGFQPHNNPAPQVQPHPQAAPQPHVEAPHPAPAGGGGHPGGGGGHPGGHR